MTRKMYDAVTIENCPTDGDLYAGYVNGQWPTFSRLPSLFPGKIYVSITVNINGDAQVLDVETGDASPQQAPGWVQRQRQLGKIPTVYCNTSTWPEVEQSFRNLNIELPIWWQAQYDNNPVLTAGAVAKQYATGNYDTSIVADIWPGIDSNIIGGTDVPAPTDKVKRVAVAKGYYLLEADGAVGAFNGAPFVNYAVLANDGSIYHFGPKKNNGVFAYPGLPAAAKLGSRYFVDIWTE